MKQRQRRVDFDDAPVSSPSPVPPQEAGGAPVRGLRLDIPSPRHPPKFPARDPRRPEIVAAVAACCSPFGSLEGEDIPDIVADLVTGDYSRVAGLISLCRSLEPWDSGYGPPPNDDNPVEITLDPHYYGCGVTLTTPTSGTRITVRPTNPCQYGHGGIYPYAPIEITVDFGARGSINRAAQILAAMPPAVAVAAEEGEHDHIDAAGG